MFTEFSKQENMFNIYIIGERYFGVSPMTEGMSWAATRLFDCQRKKSRRKKLMMKFKMKDEIGMMDRWQVLHSHVSCH